MKLDIVANRVAQPFGVNFNVSTGDLDDYDTLIQRRIGMLEGLFHNQAAWQKMAAEDPEMIIYQVFEKDIPEVNGELRFCSSVTFPGVVGDEYFMTKGHFHTRRDTAEVYYCIQGNGFMLLETEEGQYKVEEMLPGRTVYVPGFWAHRTINTGNVPLISLAVYPGDAGHDYGSIEATGFRHLVVNDGGIPQIIKNPSLGNL